MQRFTPSFLKKKRSPAQPTEEVRRTRMAIVSFSVKLKLTISLIFVFYRALAVK